MYTVILVIHLLLAVALVGLVLVQRNSQEGFGLSGGGNSLMSGQSAASLMTRATAFLAAAFMLTSIGLTWMGANRQTLADRVSTLDGALTAPAAVDVPAPHSEPATAPAPTAVPLAE